MAITATPFRQFTHGVLLGEFSLVNDEIRVALFTDMYIPDYNAHTDYFDWRGDYEVDDGPDYTWGGVQLTSVNVTDGLHQNDIIVTADTVSWTGLTATFQYAMFYKKAGPTYGPLIGAIDFGEAITVTNDDYDIAFPDGVLTVNKVS
jgi:hypothetical protein